MIFFNTCRWRNLTSSLRESSCPWLVKPSPVWAANTGLTVVAGDAAREKLVAAPQTPLEGHKGCESVFCGELRISPRQTRGSICGWARHSEIFQCKDVDPQVKPKLFSSLHPYECHWPRREGILEKVTHSEWATSIVAAPKPDGSVRLCGDFMVTIS